MLISTCLLATLTLGLPRVGMDTMPAIPRHAIERSTEMIEVGKNRKPHWLRLSVVPKFKKGETEIMLSSVHPSPMYLDIIGSKGDQPVLLSRTKFTAITIPMTMSFRWLKPKDKSGLIVYMKSGTCDNYDVYVVTFAKGLSTAGVAQYTGEGGDQTSGIHLAFDRMDRHGTLKIVERFWETDEKTGKQREWNREHRWNGKRFSGLQVLR